MKLELHHRPHLPPATATNFVFHLLSTTTSSDKKRHDKNKLLTFFQLCEEAVLGATDNCSGDDDTNRRTLGLARDILKDMLVHPRLAEVKVR